MNSPASVSSCCQSRSCLSQARYSAWAFGVALGAALVEPVGGDAELGGLVHLPRANLDLERLALGPDHGRVERAVEVELGHCDVVLEAARHRLPEGVHDAEHRVAVALPLAARVLHDHPHRGEVVDLVELLAALDHLLVDRIEVLGAAEDLGADAGLLELARQNLARLRDVGLALGALLSHHRRDLLVLARVERLEREVLELPLHLLDAEPVGERRVDLEGLP